jgi:hypothetical protein
MSDLESLKESVNKLKAMLMTTPHEGLTTLIQDLESKIATLEPEVPKINWGIELYYKHPAFAVPRVKEFEAIKATTYEEAKSIADQTAVEWLEKNCREDEVATFQVLVRPQTESG